MSFIPPQMTLRIWLRQFYASKTALHGGVVRRKVADVERIVGRLAFEEDLRRRGFRAVPNASTHVVFFNHAYIRLIA